MGSSLSHIVMNLYLEDLEQKIIPMASDDCKPWNWKWYVDDVICLVLTCKAEEPQQHMNTVDPTGSMRFTREDDEKIACHSLKQNLLKRKMAM